MTSVEYLSNEKKRIIESYLKQMNKDSVYIGIDRSLTSTGVAAVQYGKLLFQKSIKSKTYGVDRLTYPENPENEP